jgi:hypothetical protein
MGTQIVQSPFCGLKNRKIGCLHVFVSLDLSSTRLLETSYFSSSSWIWPSVTKPCRGYFHASWTLSIVITMLTTFSTSIFWVYVFDYNVSKLVASMQRYRHLDSVKEVKPIHRTIVAITCDKAYACLICVWCTSVGIGQPKSFVDWVMCLLRDRLLYVNA